MDYYAQDHYLLLEMERRVREAVPVLILSWTKLTDSTEAYRSVASVAPNFTPEQPAGVHARVAESSNHSCFIALGTILHQGQHLLDPPILYGRSLNKNAPMHPINGSGGADNTTCSAFCIE